MQKWMMVLLVGLAPLSFGVSAVPAYIMYNKSVSTLKNDTDLYSNIDNSILYVIKRMGPLLFLVGVERLVFQILIWAKQ